MATLMDGAFVGRQREMGELKVILENALSGQGRLVMLVGEPGIGKTRTAQELTAHAEAKGARVPWGRCHEYQGAPPYWPWIQAIRSYVWEQDPEQLFSEMGAGAAYICQIASDIQERLPQVLPPATTEDPEQARFRLFDSVASFFKNASRRQPLVIVLDNLHWADRSSLLLLEFLTQELGESPLLVVGTYRDVDLSRQHPLFDTLGELAREGRFQRVLLRGLGQEDVGRFIEAVAGMASPSGLVRAVYTQTEGNPFFIIEIIRWLAQEGELVPGPESQQASWRVRIPEGIREVIGRRLNRLSQQCNEALTVASVIGREFSLEQLSRLMEGLSEDGLLEVLEKAVGARIIEEMPRVMGRYQFTHALIQQTLLEELSTTRRIRLHTRIGEALEVLYGANAEAHAAELAYHFAEAEAAVGLEKVVKYSILAGEKALASYAWEEAVAHFQQGLGAKGIPLSGTESARDAEEAALLFGLGRAQAAILERDQLQEAICSLSRAFDYYANESDVGRAVAAADYLVTPVAGITRGNQLIGRALKLVPADSHQAGRLLSRYGRNLGIEENDYQGAQEALNKALTIARREKDATLEMWTLVNDALVDYQHYYHQGCLEKSLRAIEGAHRLNEPLAELSGHFTATVSLVKLGDPAGAQAHADVELALAEKLQYRSRLEAALVTQQTLAHLMGNWPVARAFIDRGLAATPMSGMTIGARVVLEYELGEFSHGEMYLERLLSDMRRVTPGPNWSYMLPAVVIPVAARITGDVNRFGVAEAAAQSVLSSPLANPLRANTARTGLALIAVQRNDVAEAAKQYSTLESLRGTVQYFSLISNDRLLGLLTQTMGNLGKATEHFEAALAFCRRAGYRPELAWSLCDYADVLLQRNQPNGQIEARPLLEEAFTISGDLGMKPLMGRVRERLERLESQSVPTPAYPHGLTQREAEVLRLIGQGKSNPQIAEELVISLNTVARHVSNIFTKIGCSSRAEAAAYAVRHGLVQ